MQYICIYFDSKTYFLLTGRIATSRQIILLVGGGIEIEQIHRRGGIEIEKTQAIYIYYRTVGEIWGAIINNPVSRVQQTTRSKHNKIK